MIQPSIFLNTHLSIPQQLHRPSHKDRLLLASIVRTIRHKAHRRRDGCNIASNNGIADFGQLGLQGYGEGADGGGWDAWGSGLVLGGLGERG